MELTERHKHTNGAQPRAIEEWRNSTSQMSRGLVTDPDSDEWKVTEQQYHQITEFLYHEARLLDHAQWDEWLALLTEDVYYRVVAAPIRLLGNEPEGQHDVMLFDDDKHTLGKWIVHLRRTTSVENPPPFARHFITNIQVTRNEEEKQFEVCSSLLLSCSRSAQFPLFLFSAERHDVLRRDRSTLQLAGRMALLDQAVTKMSNLSVFF